MRVQHADVKADDFESPKGRFGVTYREHISCEATGCPFDLEHVILKAGKKNFPPHSRISVGTVLRRVRHGHHAHRRGNRRLSGPR